MPNMPLPHIFISYSRVNKDFVARLTADLQSRGLPVWIDKQGLKPGTPNWEQALRDAIQGARAVLLVASPDSRRSTNVSDELSIAGMYKRPVYPVWAAGDQWPDAIRMGYGSVQFIDARGERYTTALDEIIAVFEANSNSQAVSLSSPPSDFEPRNPYKGLDAFTTADAGDFFGRGALTAALADRVKTDATGNERFLAVVGASGSGKSSLIMAGLIPKLKGEFPDWRILTPVKPGIHPLESLAIALAEALPGNSLKTILQDLESTAGRGLHLTARRMVSDRPNGRVVLLVDQFEELFTLTATEAERQQFITLLTVAATEPEGPLMTIITLRADFFDRPLNYAELGRLMTDHQAPILPMSLTELREAIETPAALPDVGLTFDDGLVADLVFAVREQAGALPLLQFTLDQLFQHRAGYHLTRAAYEQIGGVRGALANHAEATYAGLPSEEHCRLARALFLNLIEPGATEHDTTRRRVQLSDLALPDRSQTAVLEECREQFVRARLLTADESAGVQTIEVSHEALIREWSRLVDWLKDARDVVRQGRNIERDAANWIERGRLPDDAGLYLRDLLAAAQQWLARNSELATMPTRQFLSASVDRERDLLAQEDRRKQALDEAENRAKNAQQAAEQAISRAGQSQQAALEAERAAEGARQSAFQQQQRAHSARRLAGIIGVVAIGIVVVAIISFLAAQSATIQADQQAQAAGTRVAVVAATLTPVGSTLTAVQAAIQSGGTQIANAYATGTQSARNNEVVRLASSAQTLWTYASKGLEDRAVPAMLLSIRALQNGYSEQADTILQQVLNATGYVDFSRQFSGHTAGVLSVTFAPNGKTMLTASADGTARLWDVATGQLLTIFGGHTDRVTSAAFAPDGKTILTGSADKTARLWDVATGKTLLIFSGHSGAVTSVAFAPDGTTILTGSADKTILRWDTTTGKTIQAFTGHTDAVTSVAFAPDGKTILTGSADKTARLWDLVNGQLLTFNGHTDAITSVAFAPDGKTILTGSADKTARLWDATTGSLIQTFSGHSDAVTGVAFAPDGKTILTGSADKTARLWDVATSNLIRTFSGHSGAVTGVAFSPVGRYALTGGGDTTARLWDMTTGLTIRSFGGHTDVVTSVAFAPDGKTIVTGSADATARLWDVATAKTIQTFSGHTDGVYSVAFAPDGKTLLTGSADKTARLWDVATGKAIQTFSGHTDGVYSVAFAPDGKTILTGSTDKTARLWDVATGQTLQIFSGHAGGVYSVAFAPDGKTILTGSADQTARLWDLTTGQTLRTFSGHAAIVTSVAFAPNGKTILTGSLDHTARLWDVVDGTTLRLLIHMDRLTSVAFSPDGRYLLTGSYDKTARLWDAVSGQPLRVFNSDAGRVLSVAFAPDGKAILIGSDDRTARLWNTEYQNFVSYACTRLPRDFTDLERQQFGIGDYDSTCQQFALIPTPLPATSGPLNQKTPTFQATALACNLPPQLIPGVKGDVIKDQFNLPINVHASPVLDSSNLVGQKLIPGTTFVVLAGPVVDTTHGNVCFYRIQSSDGTIMGWIVQGGAGESPPRYYIEPVPG